MNKAIRHVAWFLGILMFALLANLTYATVVKFDDYNDEPRNRRTRDAEFQSYRAPILVGDTPIASTQRTSGSFGYERSYRSGELYAPITGYYSHDFGRTGLEDAYNEQLSGTADSQWLGRLIGQVTSTTPPGDSVQTAINVRMQRAAYDGLAGRPGAAVALNYETGEILALVSTPSYDPNLLSTTNISDQFAAWKSLTEDPSNPMLNRATRELYPPGSTFKLVTAAAALEDGKQPTDQVESPAQLTLPNTQTKLGNDTNCGGEQTTIAHALAVSCNTAFANLALELGDDKLREQAKKFGFGSPVRSDVNSVASRFPDNPDAAQTAMSGIGQFDVAASPLQMAMVAAAIANDGVLMEPHLATELVKADLTPLREFEPHKLGTPLSADNAKAMQDMMVDVVRKRTGSNAKIEGLTVGGKTGTAQSAPDRPPYAWFVGFAKEPKVAIAVFVESAGIERSEIGGNRVSAPIFAAMVKAAA